MNTLEKLKFIKSYVPVRCRSDTGCDFDLKLVHNILDDFIKEEEQ